MIPKRLIIGMKNICKKSSSHICQANLATGNAESKVDPKSCLELMFLNGVQSVFPQKLITKSVKNECDRLIIGHKWYALNKNVHLVGFGKAVLGMASTTEKLLKGHLKSGILCVPKYTKDTFKDKPEFHLKEDSVIKVYEGASNNLPDEDALCGAEAVVEKICSLNPTDILLVLISGGGSALLPKPREGLTLEDKLTTIKLLASRGASINELNTVRKKLSQVKGGGLAVMSYPITTITLILSDVVNDPLDIIASGPTVPNSDKPTAAFEILEKYNVLSDIPNNVVELSKKDMANPCIPISSKGYSHVDNFIVGNNAIALHEVKMTAEKLGFRTLLLSSKIESPVHTIGDFYVNLAFQLCKALYSNELDQFTSIVNNMLRTCQYDFPHSLADDLVDCIKLQGLFKGICIVAGGETTVHVKGSGIGGRNQELALLVSQKLYKLKQAHSVYFKKFDASFLSAGTDGIDGNSDAAGAIGCADLISRAIDNYVDPVCYLSRNDSNSFFKIADKGSHLITTGHTGTNVMDIHILLIRDTSAFMI